MASLMSLGSAHGEREVILSSQPADKGDKRVAVIVVGVSAILFLALAPFVKTPLAPVPAFIPAYQSALVVCDLITAVLLFEQLRYFRSRALLILANAYLFTAMLACIHALTFPDLLAPGGALGSGPQTTAWLYMAWHAVFPLCVVAYALDRGEFGSPRMIPGSMLATLALVAVVAAIATLGHRALPPIMSGNAYTPLMIGVVASVWAMSVLALGLLWLRRSHSVLDVWLMVVMWAWIFDIALSAVLNAGRFDLGFYAGRIYGLLAAALVLLLLLVEHGKLYRRLLDRTRQLDRARLAALEAERAKGAFLATMSHEIRTPMSGVMGMLELIAGGKLDGEQRTRLEIVRESGRSLLRILDDVLDHSRIEAGKLELKPEATSIRAVVEKTQAIYSGNATSKGLTLAHSVDARISPSLNVDSLRLGQILNNLVSNAIKFTEEGSVVVRADLADRVGEKEIIRFTISDTGCGISREDRARLFEPFAQAGTRHPRGTGLGLSICRRLASLMNGLLDMESTPGAGTRFTLTLPLTIARDEPRELAASSSNAPVIPPTTKPIVPDVEEARARRRLVLVVDDHPINRMLLVDQLKALGIAAETAGNGLEAIERWSAGGHAAILTDWRMPEMDGCELAQHIRGCESRTRSPRIPIIACTAGVAEGEATTCLVAGMDDYLAKPIDLNSLMRKLEQWVPSFAPVQHDVLAAVARSDPARERRVLEQLRRHVGDDADELRAAVSSANFDRVSVVAHRIKGASLAVGAMALAQSCTDLGLEARERDTDGVAVAMAAFERDLNQLLVHISTMEAAS